MPNRRSTPAVTTYHVLLVEDNPGDADLVRLALSECRAEVSVVVADNAVRAFEYLKGQPPYGSNRPPDLILLDLALPVIHGHKVLDVIKHNEAWRRIPVLVLSSSAASRDRILCERLGACAFIAKPIDWPGYLALADRLRQMLVEGCLQRD